MKSEQHSLSIQILWNNHRLNYIWYTRSCNIFWQFLDELDAFSRTGSQIPRSTNKYRGAGVAIKRAEKSGRLNAPNSDGTTSEEQTWTDKHIDGTKSFLRGILARYRTASTISLGETWPLSMYVAKQANFSLVSVDGACKTAWTPPAPALVQSVSSFASDTIFSIHVVRLNGPPIGATNTLTKLEKQKIITITQISLSEIGFRKREGRIIGRLFRFERTELQTTNDSRNSWLAYSVVSSRWFLHGRSSQKLGRKKKQRRRVETSSQSGAESAYFIRSYQYNGQFTESLPSGEGLYIYFSHAIDVAVEKRRSHDEMRPDFVNNRITEKRGDR